MASLLVGLLAGWSFAASRLSQFGTLAFQEGKLAVSQPHSDSIEALENCHTHSNVSLESLAVRFQPTKFGYKKGKLKYFHVGFQRFYPLWMEAHRGGKFKMLEIG